VSDRPFVLSNIRMPLVFIDIFAFLKKVELYFHEEIDPPSIWYIPHRNPLHDLLGDVVRMDFHRL
jgi:hypothetical protein